MHGMVLISGRCVVGKISERVFAGVTFVVVEPDMPPGPPIWIPPQAIRMINETSPGDPVRATLERIAEVCCANAGITLENLRSRIKISKFVEPRMYFYWLGCQAGYRLRDIAKFCRRDHASVISGRARVADYMQTDSTVSANVMSLAATLGIKVGKV